MKKERLTLSNFKTFYNAVVELQKLSIMLWLNYNSAVVELQLAVGQWDRIKDIIHSDKGNRRFQGRKQRQTDKDIFPQEMVLV